MDLFLKYIIIAFLASFFASCASKYRFIKPLSVQFDTAPDTLASEQVKIAARYHVLKKAHNRKYARKEKRNKLSLLAIRIENDGQDTLYFPEDFYVMAEKDTLYMLNKVEAYDALHQTRSEENSELLVDEGWGTFFVDLVWVVAIGSKEFKANEHFADELDEFYLLPCFVAPGVSTVGLLALEVKKGTPLRFGLKK